MNTYSNQLDQCRGSIAHMEGMLARCGDDANARRLVTKRIAELRDHETRLETLVYGQPLSA